MNTPKIEVIVHHYDNDGWASAYAMLGLYPQAELLEHDHSKPADFSELKGKQVMFVDLTPTIEIYKQLVSQGNVVALVIDHHTLPELHDFLRNEGVPLHLSPFYPSASMLCYEYARAQGIGFTSDEHAAFSYVNAMDTRTFTGVDEEIARAHGAGLAPHVGDWCTFSNAMCDVNRTVDSGRTIEAIIAKQVEEISEHAYWIKLDDKLGLEVNSSLHRSQLGDHLLGLHAEAQFVSVYYRLSPDKLKVSLRSREGGFDCSAYASTYNGGGHKRAAGYTVRDHEIVTI